MQDSLAKAALKTQRKIFDAGATVQAGRTLVLQASITSARRKGHANPGGGLFNAALMPAPVDFITDIMDMALGYASKRAQLQIGFMQFVFR